MLVSLIAAAMLAQAPAVPASIVTSLGMAPAETEAKSGVEAYRVFYPNSYNRKPAAIAFERRPGQPPKVVFYSADGKMETPASASEWRAVQDASEYADRELAPLPPEKVNSEVVVCVHGVAVSIEIINGPARHERAEAVRTARQHTCARGLTTQFGFELTRRAVEQFPACAALKDDGHGNDLMRLAVCARLSGDKIAAAELTNQIGGTSPELEQAQSWQRWMGGNARPELDWAGQVTKDPQRGDRHVARFLAAQSDLAYLHLFPSTVEGLSSQSVKVTGRIQRNKAEPAIRESAAYEQLWIWDTAAQEWMVKTWTIGAFSPLT